MDIKNKVNSALSEAEKSVKAVWEIDGVTVYIRDITYNNGHINIDWFTFKENIDMKELGSKVEQLATQLIGEQTCLSTQSSQTSSIMKSILGWFGRT